MQRHRIAWLVIAVLAGSVAVFAFGRRFPAQPTPPNPPSIASPARLAPSPAEPVPGSLRASLGNYRGNPRGIYSPDGSTLAVADESGHIRLWRLRPQVEEFADINVQPASNTRLLPLSLAFSPDGRECAYALADEQRNSSVHAIDVATMATRTVVPSTSFEQKPKAHPISIAFDPSGRRLAIGTQHRIIFHDPRTGERLGTFAEERTSYYIIHLCFCIANPKLLAFAMQRTTPPGQVIEPHVGILDTRTNTLAFVARFDRETVGSPIAVAIAPDGERLAAFTDMNRAFLWDWKTKKPSQVIVEGDYISWGSEIGPGTTRFLPDGKGWLTASYGPASEWGPSIRRRDPVRGTLLHRLKLVRQPGKSESVPLTIAPDGTSLVALRYRGIDENPSVTDLFLYNTQAVLHDPPSTPNR